MATSDRKCVYGVDFSGAEDAGTRIWIASGTIADGALKIEGCVRAKDIPGSGKALERTLLALRNLVEKAGAAVFGFDFPFGLPRELVSESSWEKFVLAFPVHHLDPGGFRKACKQKAGPPERRRRTDQEAKTPMSPYNWRLYKQTFYGIRDLLHPLVRDGLASVLPMQRPLGDRPWVIEICPASTLKKWAPEEMRQSYKKRTPEARVRREAILSWLARCGTVIQDPEIQSAILADHGGDALDSVIAAAAVHQAIRHQSELTTNDPHYLLEGFVYDWPDQAQACGSGSVTHSRIGSDRRVG